jgi:hypothetical protein
LDFLEMKKDRHFEQYFENCSADVADKREKEMPREEGGSSLVDDQDLRPMDLEAEQ